MDFVTTKEAARKWDLTERMVQYHCKAGRIEGGSKSRNDVADSQRCSKAC